MKFPRAGWIVLMLFAAGCASERAAPSPARGRATVLWISIDGLRHDYVAKHRPPLLSRLAREGAFTTQLVPVFPSLTFPSHVSEATGVPSAQHGITSNTFSDTRDRTLYPFPHEARLLEAEPIWNTASRQGVRTLVLDWPLSQRQDPSAPASSDYFPDHYDGDANDAQRMALLLGLWRTDEAREHERNPVGERDGEREPLRLIMGYVSHVDSVGHRRGPNSPELHDALTETDRLLGRTLAEAIRIFRHTARANDELYVLVTTDHGMSPVFYQANLDRMLGASLVKDVRLVTSGPIAHAFIDPALNDAARGAKRDAILRKLGEFPYLQAWTREGLPSRYAAAHPTRTGDILISLKRGYSFTSRRDAALKRVTQSGPLGMHGYPAEENGDMLGFAVIWRYGGARYGSAIGGTDLGEVDSKRLHATVARLLGIQPAPGAMPGCWYAN